MLLSFFREHDKQEFYTGAVIYICVAYFSRAIFSGDGAQAGQTLFCKRFKKLWVYKHLTMRLVSSK